MRTTVSIDDDLLRAARARAAEEGRTLGDLVGEALRARLAAHAPARNGAYVAVTGGTGGVLAGIDVTDNATVREAMDGE